MWLLLATTVIILVSYYHFVATILVGSVFTMYSILVSLRTLNDIGVGGKRINQLLKFGKKLNLIS